MLRRNFMKAAIATATGIASSLIPTTQQKGNDDVIALKSSDVGQDNFDAQSDTYGTFRKSNLLAISSERKARFILDAKSNFRNGDIHLPDDSLLVIHATGKLPNVELNDDGHFVFSEKPDPTKIKVISVKEL